MPMENNKKNKKLSIIIIGICSILIIAICLILFCWSHSTCIKYNDWWIKGRHISEVIARYGEPDEEFGFDIGYYISDSDTRIMPDYQSRYYWMVCDENGIVRDVFVAGYPGG